MRIAIVHDYLTQFGGAERVLSALTELFPHAPVFTLLHDGANFDTTDAKLTRGRVRTSFLQHLPGARSHHRYFPLLMPLAVEGFDASQFDVVLSATHSFSKGIITGPRTLHLSYCFTPTRYLWDDCHRYVREFSRQPLLQRIAPFGLSYIRLWDYYAAQRVDQYFTLSNFVAQRIKKYYHRDALVIPPPVDVDRFTPTRTDDGYYLIVSRLVPYKRIDLAIAACEKLGRRLKIVGTGPERAVLEEQAGPNTEFVGFVPDEKLPELYAGARALLFPQEEDFGITPLEAAASGKPTIAYASGGALETIVDGTTGLFFPEQSVDTLVSAIEAFEQRYFDAPTIYNHAKQFDRQRFLRDMEAAVHNQWMAHQQHYQTRKQPAWTS